MPLIATRGAASVQGFGEFAQAAAPVYIEDVFSTYLYTGNGSTQTITNNIDLSTKGGMVWTKGRSVGENHGVSDTVRGANATVTNNNGALITNGTSSGSTAGHVTAFNSNGFTLGTSVFGNGSGTTYVSWTFAKQPKFFDVVTFTGTGNTSQYNHNLGSTPGCIIVKNTSNAQAWYVYHRSLSTPVDNYLLLNSTNAVGTISNLWGTVNSTQFGFSGNGSDSYVAYLFAHDAGGFGLTGSDNVISCGSFTTDGSGNSPVVNLGYEPQWLLVKQSGASGSWYIIDTMRAWNNAPSGSTSALTLYPNLSNAEAGAAYWNPTSTGFYLGSVGSANTAFIYIAIRRGPMKTPTDTTKVFDVNLFNYGSISLPYKSTSGFVTDLSIDKGYAGTYAVSDWQWQERLVGSESILRSNSTSSESTNGNLTFDYNNGVSFNNSVSVASGSDNVHYQFSRAPGFFDVVCTTGDGSGNLSFTHNLGVNPEFIIIKARTGTFNWYVYCSHLSDPTKTYGTFTTASLSPSSSTFWNVTSSTVTTYQGGWVANNGAGVVFLFATCPGISKVGSYTGTGTTNQINCGFTGGSRLVIIKRTDSTGSWYVYDNSRGIIGGNDPYLQLDSSAGEITGTDYIDSYNPGFEISSTAPAGLNANGGTYIFLAISN